MRNYTKVIRDYTKSGREKEIKKSFSKLTEGQFNLLKLLFLVFQGGEFDKNIISRILYRGYPK